MPSAPPARHADESAPTMHRTLLILCLALFALPAPIARAAAPQPLYLVNGVPTERIDSIPPADIESIETLPADEQTIARYGERAAHGVLLITLRYDRPASFPGGSLGSYIAGRVRWDESEPAARVVLRYRITAEGQTVVCQTLEATDRRLKRRVLKALAAAPRWEPARKDGRAVESQGVLRIQLPEGKPMPRPARLIIR